MRTRSRGTMMRAIAPRLATLALLLGLAVAGHAGHAQSPAPSVSVSFGVDTAAADVGDIVRLVRAYLARPDSSAVTRGLWSSTREFDRRAGDITRYLAYQGFPATIVGVLSAGVGDSIYVVRILHATADSSRRRVMPLALQRIYALRAPGTPHGWQLSNALPRITGDWPSRSTGRITFHYAPGRQPDPERAARAARFVDSVAAMFDVPAPEHIDYYVTASPDEYFRALGLDFFPLPSGRGSATGGNALPGIVLSGDPRQAEEYLHEIVHVVLAAHVGGGSILGEGIPTWFGGSKGRSATEMFGLLAEYQLANPEVTLEALVRGDVDGPAADDARHATGALFVDAVYRSSGVAGLRALKGTPGEPGRLLDAMRTHLGLPVSDAGALERWWREGAKRAVR